MSLQEQFFNLVRNRVPSNKHLVEDLCEHLSISQDSAYRRLRGETALTMPEIKVLSNAYDISIDDLISKDHERVTFRYKWIDPTSFSYTAYLESLYQDTQRLALFDDNEILFIAKDLPIFCNFLIPEIAEFKGFFWQKTALNLPAFAKKKFDLDKLNNTNVSLGFDILKAYNLIPSTELWHPELVSSMLNQIAYYYDSGFFASDNHAFILLDKLEQLIEHIQIQTEYGGKSLYGKKPTENQSFKLYYNEVNIGDNTLCLRANDAKTVYFTQNIINNIVTHDTGFCEQTWDIHQNMINRSLELTGSNERVRNKFFRKLKNTIQNTKAQLD